MKKGHLGPQEVATIRRWLPYTSGVARGWQSVALATPI